MTGTAYASILGRPRLCAPSHCIYSTQLMKKGINDIRPQLDGRWSGRGPASAVVVPHVVVRCSAHAAAVSRTAG
jgi:hypothetical protein